MIWVINTNSNTCHIYHYEKPTQLTLVKEILHPEIRQKKSEYLTSDKPGHYKSDGSGSGGTYSQHTDPKEAAIESFSREIAKELNHGRNQRSYEKLIVIASPQMSGALFQHLDKHVKELISNNIQKDLQHLKNHELLDFLKTNAQFPD